VVVEEEVWEVYNCVGVGGVWDVSARVVGTYVNCGGDVGSCVACVSGTGEPDDWVFPFVVGGGDVGLSEAVVHWVGKLVGRVALLRGVVRVGDLWPGGVARVSPGVQSFLAPSLGSCVVAHPR
jgi:hypothetical protein